MTIIVQGKFIKGIENGYIPEASSDLVIDLRDKTVMPGWIDTHVHLESQTSPNRYIEKYTLNPADIALNSVAFAEATLLAGFTTVRDFGGSGVNISLRNAISNGTIPGPRIFTAEKIVTTTGGHSDRTNGSRKDLMGDPGAEQGIINGPDCARKAVRQHYKEGADLIKITVTGGVLSATKSGANTPQTAQFTEEEVREVVRTAADHGMKVAAHAHGAEEMKKAIRAGVSSIEHGTFLDEEVIRLFKQYGTYLVPTLTASYSIADSAAIPGYYPANVMAKIRTTTPVSKTAFTSAYRSGVKIAFGTDAGHGKNYLEFRYMIEAGMSPMDALRAATVHAAQLLGEGARIGSIEKGKLADIIATDTKGFSEVSFSMKEGNIYRQP